MDIVLRAAVTYFVVWLILRIGGKRSLSDLTSFDFVLLLIISETTQAALQDQNNSLTSTVILIFTMVGIDIGLSLLKQSSKTVDKVMDGSPLIVVEHGVPLRDRMERERIDEADILHAARELRGLERMEQIKFAVLERNGGITIIPWPRPRRRRKKAG